MQAEKFVNKLQSEGFAPFMGVPCSVFKSLVSYMDNNKEVESYICSSEGEAMGIAGGFSIAGKLPVVYMQNDGYGNAVNPLSSLQIMYRLPVLLLISWRGKPGLKDAPQHMLMGKTILRLLEIFNIPYVILKDNDKHLMDNLIKAKNHFKINNTPFAFIIEKGYFNKFEKREKTEKKDLIKRIEYIDLLSKHIDTKDIILGATGFTGRELYQCSKHKGKFYMMGSMGCLASLGFGIAKENPNRNIYILDGDGSLLMKLGTLSTIGFYKPNNIIHICFDNNQYESTGGQRTTSDSVDFVTIAKSCGYQSAIKTVSLIDFKEIISNISMYKKPQFIHVKIKSGSNENLKRPSETPEDMKNRIVDFLKK
ncbi:MAG: phosphonopyruvate decarboxylase [Atribacterota bacterium]